MKYEKGSRCNSYRPTYNYSKDRILAARLIVAGKVAAERSFKSAGLRRWRFPPWAEPKSLRLDPKPKMAQEFMQELCGS